MPFAVVYVIPHLSSSALDSPRQLRRLALTNGGQAHSLKSSLAEDELSIAIQRAIAAIPTLRATHPSIHIWGRREERSKGDCPKVFTN